MNKFYAVDGIMIPLLRIMRDLSEPICTSNIKQQIDDRTYFTRLDDHTGRSIHTFGGLMLLEFFCNEYVDSFGDDPHVDVISLNGKSFRDCTDHEYTRHITMDFIDMLYVIHKCHVSSINHNTPFVQFIQVASRKILSVSSDPLIVELSAQLSLFGRLYMEKKVHEYYYQFERMARERFISHISE